MAKLFDAQEIDAALQSQRPATTSSPIVRMDSQPLAVVQPSAESSVMTLIRLSIEKGIDAKELYAILREERTTQSKAAFITAKAKFKRECPPVPKSQANPQFSVERNGVKGYSMFAPLETMQTIADPHLDANGFSTDWKEPPPGPNGERYLHFVMSHAGGWQEEYPARISVPEKGGNSEPQKDGIAYEYARRQSFRNGTGIRIVGEDNDGNDPATETSVLTENECRTVNDLFVELKLDDAGRMGMLRIFEADSIATVKAVHYPPLCNALNARIKGLKR